MSKNDFAKDVESHWRYADAPMKFKWWFARESWKQAKGKRKPRKDEVDQRFNRILRRYGLAHLQIMRLENRDNVLAAKAKIDKRGDWK